LYVKFNAKSTVLYLKKVALFWRQVIERDMGGVRVLTDQHGVSLAEGATPHILSTQPHVESLIEQTAEGHGFSCRPVNV
jgi:hypothetical protein